MQEKEKEIQYFVLCISIEEENLEIRKLGDTRGNSYYVVIQ